jgi:23S rRNA pseudouridine1911/1915/1917 synthase
MSWSAARRLIESGKVTVDGKRTLDATEAVKAGAAIAVSMRAPKPQKELPISDDVVIYVDAQVLVARKPSGVSTVPFDERETGALSELLPSLLKRRGAKTGAPLGIVHRLDKETSGVVVFARTLAAKRHLKQQFRFHTTHRRYVAVAHGDVQPGTFRTRLVKDRGDGRRGSTENPKLGREAVTHVRVLERLRGATLVECRLETGRTHQIRIHLAEAGHPIVGERVYDRAHRGSRISAPRLLLHAAELGFEHPATGEPMRFEEPLPSDMERALVELRRQVP